MSSPLDPYIDGIRAEYESVVQDSAEDAAALAVAQNERDMAVSANEALKAENAALKKRIEELEAQPPPVTPPGDTKLPVILNERFPDGVDWDKYFSDEGGGVSAPPARFVPTPEGLKVIWIAGDPSGTRRSEIGIRDKLGRSSGAEWWELEGAPRRDPVGSERWYAIEFKIPEEYKLADSTKDQKRVIWQAHQDGGGNPPLSLEIRNGTFRLVRSVETRENIILPSATPYPGIPVQKNVWHRLLLHVLWHPTSGWIETWFDAIHVPKVTRRTCFTGDGMNIKCGSYQPGYTAFPSGYTLEHLIRWFAIGDATNKREDFA